MPSAKGHGTCGSKPTMGSRINRTNLRFYWDAEDPSRVAAINRHSAMTQSLPSGCAPDFAIGQLAVKVRSLRVRTIILLA